MKNILTYIILIFLSVACDEENSIVNVDNHTAVLSAYIFANRPIDSIRITEYIPYTDEASLDVLDDLAVNMSTGEKEFTLNSIGNGYYSYLDHIVQEDMTYTLKFDYLDETITAETYVKISKNVTISDTEISLEKIENNGGFPGGFGVDPKIVDIQWENEESDYYFVDIRNTDEDPEYVNEFFESFLEDGELPATFFQSEPEIIDIYSINSQRELQTYGTYEIIVYRLNPEYAGLYESKGNSSQSLEVPPTNVENGLGIFTAVTPHVLFLEVKEI